MKHLIDKLAQNRILSREEFKTLLCRSSKDDIAYLFQKARDTAQHQFGKKIYTRGLIEFTSYCRRNCFYCGIRCGNTQAERYRLSLDEILSCCENGYQLGFRTFVLQGGEDPYYKNEDIAEIVRNIKSAWPDCAVTLSIGEKSTDAYRLFRQAGADRYLLRHETADSEHFAKLHPAGQTAESRKACLWELKKLGYQVGAGFMVGSPFQTVDNLVDDLLFLQDLKPQMVGIGPFIPHHQTPFAGYPAGTLEQTLILISIIRLMMPNVLLPATTALGTIAPDGREKGILAGANVVMPNLSPVVVRKKYALYDHKICTGEEAAECRCCLQKRMAGIGYELAVDRGDYQPERF